ncbi:MAG: hypothetical protein M3R24_34405 [Chloroflexota bacterium]|nr:hypothetical protein [Chloroflexota bacterium]PLS79069.1 MAG: hypothetical protein CYG59_15130 [Chloroflexota bacterium]
MSASRTEQTATIEAVTVDGTLIVLGKTTNNQPAVNDEPVSSVINTPLGVIPLCAQRGYTLSHPDYFRSLALERKQRS